MEAHPLIRINQLKVPLKHDETMIRKAILKLLRLKEHELLSYSLYRESLDARKAEPFIVYTVDCEVPQEQKLLEKNKSLILTPNYHYQYPERAKRIPELRPIIIGFGPAGLFSAYLLAEMGYSPIVFERGADADERSKLIDHYWETGELDLRTNVQFGEGGAGTFSDGKLTTRIKDLRARKVLETLVECGAPEEILYRNKPHIGTDLLLPTVKTMRAKIIEMGGEVHFKSQVTGFKIENQTIKGVVLENGETYLSEQVILAVGHSARDTFELLHESGMELTQKPFAVGVRIEHPQVVINNNQYGAHCSELLERYGAADYQLTSETSKGRSVYTFCMCPGGSVVGSASEAETIVTNGMSKHARDTENANSALLVNVMPSDFGSEHPLAGIEFQRKLERAAFDLAGKNHSAPIMTVGSFMGIDPIGKLSETMQPSYKPSVAYVNLKDIMPDFITEAIEEALPIMGRRFKGFDDSGAILTGMETRSSSPVRVVRDQESLESTLIKGLYPCGEGAGYAGGIMSSACDGIKVAEKVIEFFNRA